MYRFKAFRLDPKRRALLRDGSPVPVTPKAFDILRYLVEHPNRVVSKQEIMKAVWHDTIVEEANLTVNMSLLRKALADRDDDRLIVTVARQGYQLAADVTTESSVEAVAVSAQLSPPISRWRRVAVWASVGLGILLTGASIAWQRLRHEPDRSDVMRLAVLPFDNLTGDTARDYLADGLTEELITYLARLEAARLRVIARTSVMQYKHTGKRLDQIGRELSVRYVVESSLRQSATRLRVSVRLIRVDDERDLWAGDFDYAQQDALHIEDSVAAAVARAVRLHLSPAERSRLAQEASADPIAVDDVMRGRDLFRYTDTKGGWDAARRYFLQAIAHDSGFALAWTWLSAADRRGAARGFVAADSGIPGARAAIDRAVALDANLPEAWDQRGQLERLIDWDWAAAAESYHRAIKLDPESADAVAHLAALELTLGHFDEAIALVRQAIELDPIDPYLLDGLAEVEYYAGYPDKAQEVIQSIPSNAKDAASDETRVRVSLALGRADASSVVPQAGTPERRPFLRALVASAQGQRAASDSALADLITLYPASSAYEIATVYGFQGNRDSAFAWLDSAYAQRDQGLSKVLIDPLLVRLHGDRRYAALLTRMRLPH